MIGKGNTHSDGVKLADYLLKGGPGEDARLLDMRGFASGDLRQEFADIDMIRDAATKADAALFHVQFRSVHGEGKKLTDAQWLEIFDGCDLALSRGMTQQPRAVSLHIDEKTGDRHGHGAYSLLRDTDDGRVSVERLGLYKLKLKEYSREVELKYGLTIVTSERRPGARNCSRREYEESRRLGTNIHDIRTAIMQAYHAADNGRAFDAAMKEQGWKVAAGDRRDCFVVVDDQGGKHALNKGLIGVPLKEINARLADLDRSQLPSVDHAKQMQLDRLAVREASQTRDHGPEGIAPPTGPTPSQAPGNGPGIDIKPRRDEAEKNYSKRELGQTAGEIRMAWAMTRHRGADELLEETERRGLIMVYVSREEAAASYRAREFAKTIKRQSRALKEGFAVVDQRGNVTRIDQRATGDLWEEIQKRLGGINRDELLSVDQAREVQAEARKVEFRERKQAERDAARAPTAVERDILDAATAAKGDREKFSAECEKQGIGLARVTLSDIQGLDALRQDAELARVAASMTGEAVRSQRLDDVREGDLAAVLKSGAVIKLNQFHMTGLEGIVAGDPKFKLPSVLEMRAAFEIEREELAAFQKGMIDLQLQRRDEAALERVTVFQERAANQVVRQVVSQAERAATLPIEGGGTLIEKGLDLASDVLGAVIKPVEGVIKVLSNLFASPAPVPTVEELKLAARAGAEQQELAADLAAHQANEARRTEQIERQDEEQSRPLTAPEYFRHIGRPDQPEQGRERERERERD
jgi:hypothetical protein